MRLGEVGPQTDGLAELGRDLAAVGALAAEQEAEHVVRVGAARVARRAPAGGRRWRQLQSGAGTDGRRRGSARLRVVPAPCRIARAQEGDPEIDVDGGGRRQERDRALQARPRPREVARLAQRGSEKRVAVAGGGIERRRSSAIRRGTVSVTPLYQSATPRL